MSAVVMERRKSHVFLPVVQWGVLGVTPSTQVVFLPLVFPFGSPSLCNSLDFS